MLAVIFDAAGAYLAVKYIPKLWMQIVVAIPIGIASAIIGNLIIYWILSGEMTPGESVARTINSSLWHPIITMLAIWFFRRQRGKETIRPPEA